MRSQLTTLKKLTRVNETIDCITDNQKTLNECTLNADLKEQGQAKYRNELQELYSEKAKLEEEFCNGGAVVEIRKHTAKEGK